MAHGLQVACLLSRHPWRQLFQEVLDAMLARLPAAAELLAVLAAGGDSAAVAVGAAEALLTALSKTCLRRWPEPGKQFMVNLPGVDGAHDDGLLLLRRPEAGGGLAAGRDLEQLLRRLGVGGLLAALAALLSEQRLLFVSASLPRLSACVHAALALLQPFQWQHICVP
jgi:hypothetical protein